MWPNNITTYGIEGMNSHYWNNTGAQKTFTHKLCQQWLKSIPLETNILDFGCGYGRITKQLHTLGFKNIVGYDSSRAMLARALEENPGPQYTSKLEDISANSLDLVICFALFTSCPEPQGQQDIKKTIESLTRPSAHLYISDYLTSQNPHYAKRYEQKQLGIYGCFGDHNTAIFRHHPPDHFSTLFTGWKQIRTKNILGKTLHGNDIRIQQLLYKKDDELT